MKSKSYLLLKIEDSTAWFDTHIKERRKKTQGTSAKPASRMKAQGATPTSTQALALREDFR
jgi:hypothetical protein